MPLTLVLFGPMSGAPLPPMTRGGIAKVLSAGLRPSGLPAVGVPPCIPIKEFVDGGVGLQVGLGVGLAAALGHAVLTWSDWGDDADPMEADL